MKIALVHHLHGDEPYTEEIATHFAEVKGIQIFLGNPRAKEQGVRFIDSDMNRSFTRDDTYEGRRAQKLKKQLEEYDADLVLDIHTTRTKMPPFWVITDTKQLELVKDLNENRVVYMTDKFVKGTSLIENIKNSISIEMYHEPASVDYGIQLIQNFLDGNTSTNTFDIYKVVNVVKTEDAPDVEIENFKELPNGKYPIFYGKKSSYKRDSGIEYLECDMESVIVGQYAI